MAMVSLHLGKEHMRAGSARRISTILTRWTCQSRGFRRVDSLADSRPSAAFGGMAFTVRAHPREESPVPRDPPVDCVGAPPQPGPTIQARQRRRAGGHTQAEEDGLGTASQSTVPAQGPRRLLTLFEGQSEGLADAGRLKRGNVHAVIPVQPTQERGASGAERAVAVEHEREAGGLHHEGTAGAGSASRSRRGSPPMAAGVRGHDAAGQAGERRVSNPRSGVGLSSGSLGVGEIGGDAAGGATPCLRSDESARE